RRAAASRPQAGRAGGQQVRHAGIGAAGRRVLQAGHGPAAVRQQPAEPWQAGAAPPHPPAPARDGRGGAAGGRAEAGHRRPPRDADLTLAVVGGRDTAKGTFINCLVHEERMIVSEVAGTTRDSVDVRFERDGKVFLAIDTAGVRRKKSVASDVEFYSLARAERSIRRADVVLLFFDPRLRVSKVDKQLADYILEQQKPAIFVINKWDLMKEYMPTGRFAEYVQAMFPMLDFVPLAFITSTEGRNVFKLLNLAQNLHKQACARVPTGDLNRLVHD